MWIGYNAVPVTVYKATVFSAQRQGVIFICTFKYKLPCFPIILTQLRILLQPDNMRGYLLRNLFVICSEEWSLYVTHHHTIRNWH